MKSQPHNPEFRNNPENFHPCGFTFVLVHLPAGCQGMARTVNLVFPVHIYFWLYVTDRDRVYKMFLNGPTNKLKGGHLE